MLLLASEVKGVGQCRLEALGTCLHFCGCVGGPSINWSYHFLLLGQGTHQTVVQSLYLNRMLGLVALWQGGCELRCVAGACVSLKGFGKDLLHSWLLYKSYVITFFRKIVFCITLWPILSLGVECFVVLI